MTKAKFNQKGFAALEGLLILVIIAVIGGIGWYAVHTKHQTDKILSQADKISQSTPASKSASHPYQKSISSLLNGSITFNTPLDWKSATPSNFCNGTDNSTQCTDSLEVSPTDAQKAKNSDAFGIGIGSFTADSSTPAKNWFFDKWCTCIESSDWSDQKAQINGYDAIHVTQNNSQYVDEYYVVKHDQTVVLVTARTKDTSTTAVQTGQVQDNTKYDQQIKDIATSIIFH
jgi:hypothetical protein